MSELSAREPDAEVLSESTASLVGQFDLLATSPGGVARLRELILALAIHGRLTPQNRNEVARITGAPFADDGPFELPAGWSWMSLGALQPEFQNGASSRGDPGGQPITVLRLADIKNRRVSLADTRQVRIRQQDIEKYRLRDGDILITRVNGSADIVGQFNLVEGEPHAIYCDHFIRMRVSREVLDPKYLAMFGGSEVTRSRISNLFISTAGQKTVNQGHIGSLPIAIPPLAEQARIVARVDELIRLCDALEAQGRLEAEQHARLLGTLLGTLTDSSTPEELAANWQRVADHFDLLLDRPEAVDALEQTLLQLAVRGLLVPQDSSDEPASDLLARIHGIRERQVDAGEVIRNKKLPEVQEAERFFILPTGWEWARIDTLAEVQGGIQKTPLRRPTKHHVPYLRVANVQRDFLLLDEIERFEVTEEELAKWQLASGDLLIVEGNGSENEIGRCALWTAEIDRCVYQNHLIRVRCFERELVHFARLFLNAPSGKDEMKRLAITTSGLFNLSVGKIRNFVIPVPPLQEQGRIVARVTELRRLCADLRQRLIASQATQAHLAEALVEYAAA